MNIRQYFLPCVRNRNAAVAAIMDDKTYRNSAIIAPVVFSKLVDYSSSVK
jgi:hypothetical protein